MGSTLDLGDDMPEQEVYITANATPNPNCVKFVIDRNVVEGNPLTFEQASDAEGHPLAEKLFAMKTVTAVFAFQNFIAVTKEGPVEWPELAKKVGATIREQIQSGEALFSKDAKSTGEGESEDVQVIKRVLDEIRPALAMDGGNIVFAGYNDGVVKVYMQGACAGCPGAAYTLKSGVEARIKEVLPHIKEVVSI